MRSPFDLMSRKLRKVTSRGRNAGKMKNQAPEPEEMDAQLKEAHEFLRLIGQTQKEVKSNKAEWEADIKRAKETFEHLKAQEAAANEMLIRFRGLRETVEANNGDWLKLADKIIRLQAQGGNEKTEKQIRKLHKQAENYAKRGRDAFHEHKSKFDSVSATLKKIDRL